LVVSLKDIGKKKYQIINANMIISSQFVLSFFISKIAVNYSFFGDKRQLPVGQINDNKIAFV
jgi:hypothetical protein